MYLGDSERESERLMKVTFLKCIWEIRKESEMEGKNYDLGGEKLQRGKKNGGK